MARGLNVLATTFHPELSEDLRVHRLFLEGIGFRGEGLGPATRTPNP